MEESRERGTRDVQSIDAGSGSSGRARSISPDTILSAVANEHRRAILNEVANASEQTLEYDALVDCVADRIRVEDERTSDEHRQRVRIALRHTHLPKLDEARIIDYTDETGHVEFVGGELEQNILRLVEPYDVAE